MNGAPTHPARTTPAGATAQARPSGHDRPVLDTGRRGRPDLVFLHGAIAAKYAARYTR